MIETFAPEKPLEIPQHLDCDQCGNAMRTQAYYVRQERPSVTRVWIFDTLECLRDWAAPHKTSVVSLLKSD